MTAAGVPTAAAHACATPDEVAAALDEFGPPYVVKDDGLAAGKGVVVTDDRQQALDHAAACERVIVEEYLDGPEVSLFGDHRRRRHASTRCCPPRTSSASSTATRAPTPAAWAPTRRCPGRPPTWSTRCIRDGPPADRRRDGAARHAVRRACCTPGSRSPRAACGSWSSTPASATPRPSRSWRCSTRRCSPLLLGAATGTLADVPPPTWKPGAAVTVVMASKGYPESSSKGDVIVGTETLDRDPSRPRDPRRHRARGRPPRHRRRPGARRDRRRRRRRRRPRPGLRGRRDDLLPRRPVAHRTSRQADEPESSSPGTHHHRPRGPARTTCAASDFPETGARPTTATSLGHRVVRTTAAR